MGIRVNARTSVQTTCDVSVLYDGGMSSVPTSLMFSEGQLGQWALAGTVGVWNGTWSRSAIFSEGDTRLTSVLDRQPHVSAEVVLTHADNVAVDLRDFELRYIPVERQVA